MHSWLYGLGAAVSLAACLASGVLFFLGYVEVETYRNVLAAASLAWFIFAAAWSGKTAKPQRGQSKRPSGSESDSVSVSTGS
jgi:hypothetical protein